MKKIFNVKKNEIIFALIFGLILGLITLIPIIYGYATEPEGKVFMGLAKGVGDTNTYFDYMNQAKEGHFLFTNSYTAEEVPHLMIRPLYWFMGLFTIFLSPIFVYHFFRVLLIILFVLTIYYFSAYFFKEKRKRVLSTIIISTGAGLGWFAKTLNGWLGTKFISIDLWVTEAIPFNTLNGNPHFIFSYILTILAFLFFIIGIERKDYKYAIYSGLCAFILGFEHIYNIVPLFVVTGLYALYVMYKQKKIMSILKKSAVFYLIAIPSSIYYFLIFMFNPFYKSWSAQNVLLTPNLSNVLLGYGLVFVMALFFVLLIATKKIKYDNKTIFLSIWFVVNFALLYAPISFQIRFMEGLFIPMALLAVSSFYFIVKKIKFINLKVLEALFILILIPTSILIFIGFFNLYYYPSSIYSVPYELSESEYDALIWLKENTDSSQIVFANPKLSNYIPRVSGNRVYAGHWAQTIDFQKKYNLANRAYNEGLFPEFFGVDYVIWYEEISEKETIYHNQGIYIYEASGY